MKLHILSDLHIEFSNYEIPVQDADILVLAGDIGLGLTGIEYAAKYKKHYRHVIYVPGNHEFYGEHLSRLSLDLAKAAKNTGVMLLDNNHIVIDDILIVGSTLWTDFKLYGNKLEHIGFYMNRAFNLLNDFSRIRYATYWFQPSHCATLCLAAQDYISKTLDNPEFDGYKKIVVSHHGPSLKSIHPKYSGSEINPCFSSNLDHLVVKSDLWIHGHTHESLDYFIDDSHVVCNPRGYSKHQDKQENIFFNPKLIIDI